MQKQSPFYSNQYPINPIHGSQGFDSGYSATTPFEKVYVPSNVIVVSSRQRDCNRYPSPSYYKVDVGDTLNNITSIEVKAANLPKSSYNVHVGNNKIDFSIGSSITEIKITNRGNLYATPPTITISAPELPGVQAVATCIINTTGNVVGINIINPGSGYIASRPPSIIFSAPSQFSRQNNTATATAVVGTHYTATLRPGQYTIGGNTPTGLIKEIQNAMNYEVNGGNYNLNSTTPFEVRLVSQYPELDATTGAPESVDTCATQFNRIQITNIIPEHWEMLFCSGPNKFRSARAVLGFPWEDSSFPVLIPAVPTVYSAGLALRAAFDYDLLDDPKYVIMSLWVEENNAERMISADNSFNRKFATMIFDANPTDVIKDTTGTLVASGGVNYLSGPITKGTFWAPAGTFKAIKGTDYDIKKITFSPPIGKLTSIAVQFTCYGNLNGGTPILYDFQGRDNDIILEVKAEDQKSGVKG